MSESSIKIVGAREHNLKNVDVEIPRDQLVVITGVPLNHVDSLRLDRRMITDARLLSLLYGIEPGRAPI